MEKREDQEIAGQPRQGKCSAAVGSKPRELKVFKSIYIYIYRGMKT